MMTKVRLLHRSLYFVLFTCSIMGTSPLLSCFSLNFRRNIPVATYFIAAGIMARYLCDSLMHLHYGKQLGERFDFETFSQIKVRSIALRIFLYKYFADTIERSVTVERHGPGAHALKARILTLYKVGERLPLIIDFSYLSAEVVKDLGELVQKITSSMTFSCPVNETFMRTYKLNSGTAADCGKKDPFCLGSTKVTSCEDPLFVNTASHIAKLSCETSGIFFGIVFALSSVYIESLTLALASQIPYLDKMGFDKHMLQSFVANCVDLLVVDSMRDAIVVNLPSLLSTIPQDLSVSAKDFEEALLLGVKGSKLIIEGMNSQSTEDR